MRAYTIGIVLLLATVLPAWGSQSSDASQQGHKHATWHVANNGSDSASCGGVHQPCRSITQAIANAAPDDLIIVGPGRYGKLTDSGGAIPGEENAPASCVCMMDVNKSLTIVSRDGARETVIAKPLSDAAVVRISASHVIFGVPGRGFTVSGADTYNGIWVDADEDVWVMGNIARDNIGSSGVQVVRRGRHHHIIGNAAFGNGTGFGIFNEDTEVRGNRASGNGSGFYTDGVRIRLENNVAVANVSGFGVAGTNPLLRRNSAIGNKFFGIVATLPQEPGTVSSGIRLEQNNIYGNNTDLASPRPGCGLLNSNGGQVEAKNNYWGAPTGPGSDPADLLCDLPPNTTTFQPVATKEFRVRALWDFDW